MSLKDDALILLSAVPDLHATGAAKWVEEAAHILRQVAHSPNEAVGRDKRAFNAGMDWGDAVSRDAARYRWLRRVSVFRGDNLPDNFWNDLGDTLDGNFDAAIDAAMRDRSVESK